VKEDDDGDEEEEEEEDDSDDDINEGYDREMEVMRVMIR
jgi:hypothetical protein